MLKAAAERGVTVNIIIYKEVQAALTLDSAVSKSVANFCRNSPLTSIEAYQKSPRGSASQH